MDTNVIISILALVSSLGGIVIANRFTARTAKAAQETSAEIEKKKLDATSWQEALKLWKDDVKQLREQRADDEHRYDIEVKRLQDDITEMRQTLQANSKQQLSDFYRINGLVAWSRNAVKVMRENGIAFPAPPPGVSESLPPTGPGSIPPVKD